MSTSSHLLDAGSLTELLSIRDLTDPAGGPHAIQELLHRIVDALVGAWGCEARWVRRSPIVSVVDNYDRLRIPPDAVARDARYTRYVSDDVVLRTHSSAHIPGVLGGISKDEGVDVLLVIPGLVYRRDSIDRLHTGTPHQADLWRVRTGRPLTVEDLDTMVTAVVESAVPGCAHRWAPAVHPYTLEGREVEVTDGVAWVEILECGLAHPEILADAGLDRHTGLAMGVGPDRLLMLRKGIPDIRLLRSDDDRVAAQMTDLHPYRAVSNHPPVHRDISVAVDADEDAETLGDRVRTALGADADSVESVEIVTATPACDLPDSARSRLGIAPDQVNVLVRVTLRHPTRTLTDREANALRDRIASVVHRGSRTV